MVLFFMWDNVLVSLDLLWTLVLVVLFIVMIVFDIYLVRHQINEFKVFKKEYEDLKEYVEELEK